MKPILLMAALCVAAPLTFAGESKTCDQAKASCCEKTKGAECTTAKKSCAKEAALRQALLTHKGAMLTQR